MINIGLLGLGKTGKVIAAELLREEGLNLKWVVRRSHTEEGEFAGILLGMHKEAGQIFSADRIDFDTFFEEHPVDIVVDFSHHSTIDMYYEGLKKSGIALISAISAYPQEGIDKINDLSETAPVLFSPNITLGINFLIVISEVLQKIAPWADVEIVEEHFRGKPEVSGTALRIASVLGLDKQDHINSIRIGGVVGKHEVIFGLPNQTIRLVHETNNRAAFGQGIIFGIKYLYGKGVGSYSMDQIIKEKFVSSISADVL
jgi:4-hydroxy-tetrahydrodipicolinate reductase